MPAPEPIGTVLWRALCAAGVVAAHVFLGFVVMSGVWLTEKGIGLFFREPDPKFFGSVPIRWLFDAGEAGILIVFVAFGIYEAFKQLKG